MGDSSNSGLDPANAPPKSAEAASTTLLKTDILDLEIGIGNGIWMLMLSVQVKVTLTDDL